LLKTVNQVNQFIEIYNYSLVGFLGCVLVISYMALCEELDEKQAEY